MRDQARIDLSIEETRVRIVGLRDRQISLFQAGTRAESRQQLILAREIKELDSQIATEIKKLEVLENIVLPRYVDVLGSSTKPKDPPDRKP